MHRKAERPWVFGHRGASVLAPENTLLGFARALDAGADGIELDVRDAADGTVVVVHDPTLERVAKDGTVVAAATFARLERIELGEGQRVPALDQAIDLVRGRDALLNVEVKGDVPDRVRLCRAIARTLGARTARDREGILISSFRPEMLEGLRWLGVKVPLAFLFDLEHTGMARARFLARVFRPDGMHPHHTLASRENVARWRARGCFVGVWTVDDADRARALAVDGADAIITNDPARIRAAIQGSAAKAG